MSFSVSFRKPSDFSRYASVSHGKLPVAHGELPVAHGKLPGKQLQILVRFREVFGKIRWASVRFSTIVWRQNLGKIFLPKPSKVYRSSRYLTKNFPESHPKSVIFILEAYREQPEAHREQPEVHREKPEVFCEQPEV